MANDQHLGLDRSFLRGSPRLKLTFALAICFSVLSDAFDAVQVVNPATWSSRAPRVTGSQQRLWHPSSQRPSMRGGRAIFARETPAALSTTPRHQRLRSRRRTCLRRRAPTPPASLGLQVSGSQRYARPPLLEDTDDDGETGVVATPQRKKWDRNRSGGGEEREKSALGKFGDGAKAVFNGVMSAVTLASLLLAAETLWELRGTPLTLSNAVPTLTKLLPATGIGVFGAVQVVGLAARVVRVIVTLPIMLSGTWVILQNVPRLLPTGTDLKGAGALAALLATPEVLEAAAVVALIGGITLWAINFAATALGGVMPRRDASDDEEPG